MLHVLLKVLLLKLGNQLLLKLRIVRVLLLSVGAELVNRLSIENVLNDAPKEKLSGLNSP